jgi:hypothetical protein
VISAASNTDALATRAGAQQSISLPPKGAALAWAEPYDARFPHPVLTAWIRSAKPLFDAKLGGDVTLVFGRP